MQYRRWPWTKGQGAWDSIHTASISQLARLARALLDSDSVVLTERPVQPLNGRKVVCYGA